MIPSRLLVVTDRHGSARPLVDTVRAALDGGARWVWFRDRDLERAARKDLALRLLDLVRAAGGRMTVGGDAALAAEIGADGVHLGMDAVAGMRADARNDGGERVGSEDASGTASGRVLPHTGLSAHSLGDVRRAAEAGADYVTLSPIFSSASKPGYGPALGLGALHETAALGLPVIALGGISADNAAACREAGASGVAVMGGIMGAANPAAATRRFIAALGGAT